VCFETFFKKMQIIFPNAMIGLRVGWTHFHKTTPTNPKMVFDYGAMFVTSKDIQLLKNKP
jgi:hypothetical protein